MDPNKIETGRYAPSREAVDRLNKTFTYHPPNEAQRIRFEELRRGAREFGQLLLLNCPPSAEQQLAIRRLQECVFWGNASIAFEPGPEAS